MAPGRAEASGHGRPEQGCAPGAPSSLAIFNNRANLLQPESAYRETPVAGGKGLLNAGAFREPPSGRLGNSGRNA